MSLTFPTNATMVDWLSWINTNTSEVGLGIFFVMVLFILPFIYLIGSGKDVTSSIIISGFISAIPLIFLSFANLVPAKLVIIVVSATAIAVIKLIFEKT